MATVAILGTATWTTAAGNKTVTATPTLNDVIVIVHGASAAGATSTVSDNNSGGGGTYTKVIADINAVGSNQAMHLSVRNALISSATSTIFTATNATDNGGGLVVMRVTGMSRTGSSAVKQSAVQEIQTAGTTPAPVMGSAVLTANAVIGAVINVSNPAALTPRSSPAYSEIADVGYATPVTGLEIMKIDSGETATTITWGGTSATGFGSLVAELDTSAAAAVIPPGPTIVLDAVPRASRW